MTNTNTQTITNTDTQTLVKVKFETAIMVEDYMFDETEEETEEGDEPLSDKEKAEFAFEECRDDVIAAEESARAQVDEALGRPFIGSILVQFVEFDSSNWTHAAGIFNADAKMTQDEAIQFWVQGEELTREEALAKIAEDQE